MSITDNLYTLVLTQKNRIKELEDMRPWVGGSSNSDRIAELEEEFKTVTSNYDIATIESGREIHTLEAKVSAQSDTVEKLGGMLTKKDTRIESLEDRIGELNQEICEHEDKYGSLNEKHNLVIANYECRVKALQAKVKELETQGESLAQDVYRMQQERSKLYEEAQGKDDKVKDLEANIKNREHYAVIAADKNSTTLASKNEQIEEQYKTIHDLRCTLEEEDTTTEEQAEQIEGLL